MRPFTLIRLLPLLIPALAACSSADMSGPPSLRLGRDECAACGMLISEERCSSALLVQTEVRRDYVLFDDLGCMLDYEREHAGQPTVIARFVHDHDTSTWLSATDAVFLMTTTGHVSTPMGSGIVAFATAAQATAVHPAFGGSPLTFDQVAAARRDTVTTPTTHLEKGR